MGSILFAIKPRRADLRLVSRITSALLVAALLETHLDLFWQTNKY